MKKKLDLKQRAYEKKIGFETKIDYNTYSSNTI